jgi:UDP-glucose 4-epimerase
MRFLSLRYFNPIGAHPSANIGELPSGVPDNLVPYVTQTAIGRREKLTVFGNDYDTPDGSCLRDFIHVMDLAEAHISGLKWLMDESKGLAEVINIGAGRGVSVLEIIHTFEEVSGEKLNWEFGSRRKGDVAKIYADITKANDLLNWTPKYEIREAMQHAWAWEQKIAE